MNFFPKLEFSLLNGWIFLVIFFLIFAITLKTCSKEVISRLYDDKGWTKKQYIFTKLAKLMGLVHSFLVIFTPINIISLDFLIGAIIYIFGTIGMTVALINFKKAPLNNPISSGLYKISRNPQLVMIYLVSLGNSFIISSWTAVIIVVISMIFSHFRILGEERRLFEQYGDLYLKYKKKVPRYFLLI